MSRVAGCQLSQNRSGSPSSGQQDGARGAPLRKASAVLRPCRTSATPCAVNGSAQSDAISWPTSLRRTRPRPRKCSNARSTTARCDDAPARVFPCGRRDPANPTKRLRGNHRQPRSHRSKPRGRTPIPDQLEEIIQAMVRHGGNRQKVHEQLAIHSHGKSEDQRRRPAQ